jgi:hypothetical protein
MFGRWRKRPAEAVVQSPVGSFHFANDSNRILSVYIEPMADRYVLRPGETLQISARVEYEGGKLFIDEAEEAMTLWINGWLEPGEVTIDGKPAVSWPAEGRASSDPHE